MKKLNSLQELLVEELQDLYHAEKQLTKALPKMAKAASLPALKSAFEEHLRQTEEHIERLEDAFDALHKPARAKTCKAMEGLIEEGSEIIEAKGEPSVKDAALIIAAQKVEHYEIAGYGSVCALARFCEEEQVAEILHQTLEEEKETNEKLNELAEKFVNIDAEEAGRK